MRVLNTEETSDAILDLIKNANERCFLICPYFKIKERYKKAILGNKNCQFFIIFGKTEMEPESEFFLYDAENVSIFYCHDLHAKIYISEKEAILSSMNLYKFSENHNFEISTYIKSNENEFERIEEIISNIHENSVIDKISQSFSNKYGYCIRTGIKIEFNIERPLSYEAWENWNIFKNKNYPEKYCHLTGEKSFGKTCFAYPILKK